MAELVKVAAVGDIPPGSARTVDVKGEPVAVFNVKGKFYAIHNTCLHAGGPLGDGVVDDGGLTVECPWHGWVYSLETGETEFRPGAKVRTYKVNVQGSDLFIEI